MKYYIILLCLLCNTILMAQQSEHEALLDGTVAYDKGDFETAEQNFKAAIDENNSSLKGNFNLGNALFKRKKYDEAIGYFQNAASGTEDNGQKSEALYNLGNSHLAQAKSDMTTQGQAPPSLGEEGQNHLKKAIDAYKDALRNNPKDYDAKNNLAAAYKILRQQQKQQQEKEEEKEKEEEDKKDNREKKEEEEKEGDNKDKKPSGSDESDENKPIENSNEEMNGKPQEMNKDEVDRLMDIIEQEDKKVQEKLMKRKRTDDKRPEKDW